MDSKKIFLAALPFLIYEDIVFFLLKDLTILTCFSGIFISTFFTFFVICLATSFSKIFYNVHYILQSTMFLSNIIYFNKTDKAFSFSLLKSFSEGSEYILDTILEKNNIIYFLIFLALTIYVVFINKKVLVREKTFMLIPISLLSLTIGFVLIFTSGDSYGVGMAFSPKVNFKEFNDSNKNLYLSGLTLYTIRDFGNSFIFNKQSLTSEEEVFLDEAYKEEPSIKNDKTGIFDGYNLVLLQIEGGDKYLIDYMPNLKKMSENSLYFENHYSLYNGGGSTFNSDLMVSTGYSMLSTGNESASFYSNLTYKDTLANRFKEKGYTINAFHNNYGIYYDRTNNYKAFGYDSYNGLIEDFKYNDLSWRKDTELSKYFDKMLPTDTPFVSNVITMSIHMPFESNSKEAKLFNVDESLNEDEIIKIYAKETDDFIGMLLDELDKRGLSDNTIIVAYSDHFLYTVSDKENLVRNRNGVSETNDLDNTTFLIYGKDLSKEVIDKINSHTDILPTILNLFGFSYNKNQYVGRDIFDDTYEGLVIYPNLEYRDKDGVHSIQDGSYEYNLLRKNDLTLLGNYFKKDE